MSNGTRVLLDQAVSLIQQGDRQAGKRLLARALRQEPDNVDAWLWLATAVDDLEQRVDCLRRVLAISPHNKIAWKRLAVLTSTNPQRDRPRVTGYEGLEFQCARCGGRQEFDIGQQGLLCTQCGHFEPIVQPEGDVPPAEQEIPLHVTLSSPRAHLDLGGTLPVTCRRCGSTTTWSARQGTVECPFCGTDLVLHAAAEVPLILPQGLIPFQVAEKQAREAVHAWWKKGWFRPPALAQRAAILRMRGVYIPVWTFDNLYRVQWTEQVRDHGFDQEEQREYLRMFDDVLVCGSDMLSEQVVSELEPYHTRQLVCYQPAYLAGWPVEVSQLSMADASLRARERMVQITRNEFPPDAKVTELATEYMTYKHILLPVWLGEYRYRDTAYHFAVNGQTGKVGGEVPRSLALAFDLIATIGMLLPFAALGFVLYGPKPEWRLTAVGGALVVWLAALLVYFLAVGLGWRDADFGRTVREVPEWFKDRSLSPKNQQTIAKMVEELSEEPDTLGMHS